MKHLTNFIAADTGSLVVFMGIISLTVAGLWFAPEIGDQNRIISGGGLCVATSLLLGLGSQAAAGMQHEAKKARRAAGHLMLAVAVAIHVGVCLLTSIVALVLWPSVAAQAWIVLGIVAASLFVCTGIWFVRISNGVTPQG